MEPGSASACTPAQHHVTDDNSTVSVGFLDALFKFTGITLFTSSCDEFESEFDSEISAPSTSTSTFNREMQSQQPEALADLKPQHPRSDKTHSCRNAHTSNSNTSITTSAITNHTSTGPLPTPTPTPAWNVYPTVPSTMYKIMNSSSHITPHYNRGKAPRSHHHSTRPANGHAGYRRPAPLRDENNNESSEKPCKVIKLTDRPRHSRGSKPLPLGEKPAFNNATNTKATCVPIGGINKPMAQFRIPQRPADKIARSEPSKAMTLRVSRKRSYSHMEHGHPRYQEPSSVARRQAMRRLHYPLFNNFYHFNHPEHR